MAGKSPVAELSDHIGYLLRLVSNQVSASFARKLAGEDVTVAEWVVLRILFEGQGVPPNKLADMLRMTRGAISKLADRLIDKRLILRTDSPDDGRSHSLTLTGKGNRLVPRLAALADENDQHFFGVLEPGDRVALQTILRKLVSRHDLDHVPID